MAKILCLDFDGVIHSYEKGWQGGKLYGSVLPGFWSWAIEAFEQPFELVVYSSRSASDEGLAAMGDWLQQQWELGREDHSCGWTSAELAGKTLPAIWFSSAPYDSPDFVLSFAAQKPPAFLTIDDRAICFEGDWSERPLQPKLLASFTPWNVKS